MSRPAVISALPTPFLTDGVLDERSMDALLEHVGGQRIDAVFVNGTTAEFPSLTRAERRACVAATVRVLGPERTIAHIGASSAYEAALLTKDAIASGAERFAAIVPYYMHSDFNAVRDYFVQIRHVISANELYLYHYPARTGVGLTPAEAAQLVDEFGLAGAKVSMPGVDFVAALAPLLGDGAVVFTGNDDLMVEAHAVGGAGIVSGVSSALPEPFVDLAEALRLNVDVDSSRAIVNDTVSVLGTSIRQIKTALLQLSVFDSDRCRMAIPQQQSADAPEVARLLERSRSANSAQRIG